MLLFWKCYRESNVSVRLSIANKLNGRYVVELDCNERAKLIDYMIGCRLVNWY